MRFLGHEDDNKQEQALVLVMPHAKDESYIQSTYKLDWMRIVPMNYLEGEINMDLNTLIFIPR